MFVWDSAADVLGFVAGVVFRVTADGSYLAADIVGCFFDGKRMRVTTCGDALRK